MLTLDTLQDNKEFFEALVSKLLPRKRLLLLDIRDAEKAQLPACY